MISLSGPLYAKRRARLDLEISVPGSAETDAGAALDRVRRYEPAAAVADEDEEIVEA
jgi:hypothetical protein